MDLRQMTYFITIIENDFNISKASKKLNVSQPSISRVIIEMENKYNVKLFEKSKLRYCGLTSVGEEVFYQSKKIIDSFNQLELYLNSIDNTFKGHIKIGIPPLIISFLCFEALPELIKEFTDLKIEFIEKNAYVLHQMLVNNELDIAITTEVTKHSDVFATNIFVDEMVCVMSKDHPFSSKKKLNLKQISEEKIFTLNSDFIIHQQLLSVYKQQNLTPNFYFTSGQWDLLVNMAQRLNGIAILPRPFTTKMNKSTLVTVGFEPKIKWEIDISINKNVVQYSQVLAVKNFFIEFFSR